MGPVKPVDHRGFRIVAHPAGAQQMSAHVLRCHRGAPGSLGTGGIENLHGTVLQKLLQFQVIRMVLVGDPQRRPAPVILQLRVQGNAVFRPRQRSSVAEHRHLVIELRGDALLERLAEQRSFTRDIGVEGVEDGIHIQKTAGIQPAAPVESALRIRVVEVVQDPGDLDALVFIERMFENGMRRGMAVEHQVLAHQAAAVGQPVGVPAGFRLQQDARRLRTVGRQDDTPGLLRLLLAVGIEVDHLADLTPVIGFQPEYLAFGAYLAVAGRLCQGQHGGQGGGFGVHLAAKRHAEAAVNAARPPVERAGQDGHGRRLRVQTQFFRTAFEQHAGGFHRHRRHRVGSAPGRVKGPGCAGNPHLPVHFGVVGFQFLVADGPVGKAGATDLAQLAALVEIHRPEAPVIAGEMHAAAT